MEHFSRLLGEAGNAATGERADHGKITAEGGEAHQAHRANPADAATAVGKGGVRQPKFDVVPGEARAFRNPGCAG